VENLVSEIEAGVPLLGIKLEKLKYTKPIIKKKDIKG
jgi:hypothetical protein